MHLGIADTSATSAQQVAIPGGVTGRVTVATDNIREANDGCVTVPVQPGSGYTGAAPVVLVADNDLPDLLLSPAGRPAAASAGRRRGWQCLLHHGPVQPPGRHPAGWCR